MKKKEKYSLTAKQRKEKRHQRDLKEDSSIITEEEIVAAEARNEKKTARRSKIIRLTAIITAIVLGIACVVTGTVLGITAGHYYNGQESLKPADGKTKEVVNPIAVITLSNDKKIEIELNYKDCPAAVANFVYLSESKFYDNTMFHNSAFGFLAFSGYTTPETHKAQDESVVAALKGFSSDRSIHYNQSNFKLGYRLTSKNASAPADKTGYMAFMSGTSTAAYSSSTSYLFIYDINAQLYAGQSSNGPGTTPLSSLSYMGKINEDSMKVIEGISKMTTSNSAVKNIYSGSTGTSISTTIEGWRYPAAYQQVMIKSVKITKLDKTLKKNIVNHFEDFVYNAESEMKDAIKANSSNYVTWSRAIMGSPS